MLKYFKYKFHFNKKGELYILPSLISLYINKYLNHIIFLFIIKLCCPLTDLKPCFLYTFFKDGS